ncbi:MAG TPA: nuclear transport factor 2 family protein [Candidatus Acidoferrales bacterium]|nr:nuclear transport factor 2 family protein [Candidatus Acidoferrales bacterium]
MKQGLAGRVPHDLSRSWLAAVCWLVCGVLALAVFGAAALAQRKEQKGKKSEPVPGLPDQQVIESAISEMLAAWQIGNVELMHKHYADDVVVVSGAWEAPLVGWTKYVQAYQAQRDRMQQANMDRMNSYITVRGNTAWAVYQWRFSALVDGKPAGAQGHTTLVLERRDGAWLIVHNHTSIVPEFKEPTPANPVKPDALPSGERPGA